MSVNVNSITDSYNAWYDYKYGGNTRGISASEISDIETRWKSNLKSWEAQAAKDENKYEISDDDFSSSKAQGKQNAKDQTGCSGKKGGMIARGAADAVVSVGGALAQAPGTFLNKAIEPIAPGKGPWIITAPLALAVGIAYQAKKPNKDEHEAAVELRDDMLPNAQGDLSEAQAVMDEATENVIELSEEANDVNEDANETIEENKTRFDQYRGALVELQEKAKSGEKLTDSEKELYQELVPSLQDLGEGIQETAEDVGEEVTDLRDDIGSYQSEYDSAADTIAEVQGLTDYAAGFDETAQIMTYVEAVSQGLNVATGTQAALQAGKYALSHNIAGAWAWAFVGMGTAGAVMSGLGAAEQYKWAGDIGQEIDLREATQDFGSQTLDSYNDQIDIYDDNIAIVEDLEVAIPDDLEIPEEIPEMGETDSTSDSPMLAQQEDDKKKDKEEKA